MEVTGHSKWEDLPVVKLIKFISIVMGLTSTNYKTTKLLLYHTIYSILLCIVFVISVIFSIENMLSRMHHLGMTLFVFGQILLTITTVYAIFSAVVLHRNQLKFLHDQIEYIENQLNKSSLRKIQYNPKKLLLQVVGFECFVIMLIAFDLLGFLLKSAPFEGLLVWFLYVVIISVLIMQIYLYSTCLGSLFEHLNYIIPRKMKHYSAKNGLIRFMKLHEDICGLISVMNTIFGFKIFLINSNIILNIVVCVDRLIDFFIQRDEGHKHFIIITTSALYLVLFIAFGAILSVSCDSTASEAKKTSLISYKILMNYPSCPKNAQEKAIKEELILLAEHISRRNVHFSAGVFTVDYTMLFMIFGSIATYLVIILQFK